MQKDRCVELGDGTFKVAILINPSHMQQEFGPRFDNTALVSQVRVGNQPFLKERYGLVDDFGIYGMGALNYAQAKPGESFIKIGVGELSRIDDKPYDKAARYPVRDWWPTVVTTDKQSLAVSQQSDLVAGYAYRYSKRYHVESTDKVLTVEYTLTNVGRKAFDIEHYNHNFFQLSDSVVDESYQLETAFDLVPPDKPADWLTVGARSLQPIHKMIHSRRFPTASTAAAPNHRLTLEHRATGRRIIFSGNHPISRFVLWVDLDAFCPEVFYQAHIEPGTTLKWSRKYEFNVP